MISVLLYGAKMERPGKKSRCQVSIVAVLLVSVIICSCTWGRPKPSTRRPLAYEAVGMASFYGKRFHGRKTASGERFNMHAMTAAHKRLSFGTKVRVTHLKNGRTVMVRINDRGPFAKGRIIDLSYAAAKKLGMIKQGVAKVRIRVERN